MARHYRTLPRFTEKQIRRFWRKVDKNGPVPADKSLGSCWLWTGSVNSYGYGNVCRRDKESGKDQLWLANRVSYFFATGDDPGPLFVLHKCNNPPCVNPAHLYLGSYRENAADLIRAGTHPAHHPNRIASLTGENNPLHKLTPDKVREIRALAESGLDNATIGRRYGVSTTNIWHVVARNYWSHVQ